MEKEYITLSNELLRLRIKFVREARDHLQPMEDDPLCEVWWKDKQRLVEIYERMYVIEELMEGNESKEWKNATEIEKMNDLFVEKLSERREKILAKLEKEIKKQDWKKCEELCEQFEKNYTHEWYDYQELLQVIGSFRE